MQASYGDGDNEIKLCRIAGYVKQPVHLVHFLMFSLEPAAIGEAENTGLHQNIGR